MWLPSAAARCSTSSGYAAATAHRGIRLIRVPTTVLAQDDSGVGVKNGVNAFGKKNYLGTFAPPFAVINDFSFLSTLLGPRLARRHRRGGQGGADQGPRRSSTSSSSMPAMLVQRDLAAMEQRDPALGGAAPAAHRHRRRSVRAGIVASARLRALGGAQAGAD